MPRQDVPYGGAICRLKERIAEIFDKLGEKLHTINGVPGDGDGNVKIVSGSSAVVINNDPTQNEIEIALDSSQLPAASVSSVNGQTGAVALDAGDIPTVGGDVQADLQDLANDISGNTAAINAEVLARQGADSALQTNINTVTASLPAAAAAAVAADPTVAQLVVDLGNKVNLTDVSTVETPDTIAKRNGSGRLVAADPASGATDKTLTTANWISQTGENRPNNLIHSTGEETIRATKYIDNDCIFLNHAKLFRSNLMNSDTFYKLAETNYIQGDIRIIMEITILNNVFYACVTKIGNNPINYANLINNSSPYFEFDIDIVDNKRVLWVKKTNIAGDIVIRILNSNINGAYHGMTIERNYVVRT